MRSAVGNERGGVLRCAHCLRKLVRSLCRDVWDCPSCGEMVDGLDLARRRRTR